MYKYKGGGGCGGGRDPLRSLIKLSMRSLIQLSRYQRVIALRPWLEALMITTSAFIYAL